MMLFTSLCSCVVCTSWPLEVAGRGQVRLQFGMWTRTHHRMLTPLEMVHNLQLSLCDVSSHWCLSLGFIKSWGLQNNEFQLPEAFLIC